MLEVDEQPTNTRMQLLNAMEKPSVVLHRHRAGPVRVDAARRVLDYSLACLLAKVNCIGSNGAKPLGRCRCIGEAGDGLVHHHPDGLVPSPSRR